MSFLTPLYALGALAIALPIAFHFLQRRPRRQIEFSSLMFLSPSPPRFTRRSRLNHLFLLLLRALALLLLAAAFARPFARSLAAITGDETGRQVLLVLDRSASMQREGLWQQAVNQIDLVLQDLGPRDRVGLYWFDDRFETAAGLPDSARLASGAPEANADAIREAVASLQPGWHATDLGNALRCALDVVSAANANARSSPATLIVLSDFQHGAKRDALAGIAWPPDVMLDARVLVAKTQRNVGLQRLVDEQGVVSPDPRFRLTNDIPSEAINVEVGWQNARGDELETTHRIQVPPGRSRVVSLPQPIGADRLVLRGDGEPFDNTTFVTPVTARRVTVPLLGSMKDDPTSEFYFLKRAALGVGSVDVVIVPLELNPSPAAEGVVIPKDAPLVICTQLPSVSEAQTLRTYVQDGGRVFVVLRADETGADSPSLAPPDGEASDQAGTTLAPPKADGNDGLAALLGVNAVSMQPRRHEPYAMLGEIDFRNPLFAPFRDAKYSDFTKIRVWQSTRLTADHEQPWQVLARYDDGVPCFMEQTLGNGKIWILTTSWRPSSSQLALSTKFVPLLAGMLRHSAARLETPAPLHVGQPIALAGLGELRAVIDPRSHTYPLPGDATQFTDTDWAGVYTIAREDSNEQIAINLPPDESRVQPMDLSEFERLGIQLGEAASVSEVAARERQLKDFELESRQQGWRWLLLGALAILIAETVVAGRTSRREHYAEVS